VRRRADRERHAFHDLDALTREHLDLGGVVRQQPDATDAEASQQLRADAEVALIVLEAEPVIRLDRVEPGVLQCVGPQLVGETDAAAFLIEVEQHAAAGVRHHGHGGAQLRTAVALEAAEHVTGEAGRVQPHQDGLT
jgi:hypothetical protein